MSISISFKHLWLELNPKYQTDEFINEFEKLLQKYARATFRDLHYRFTFKEEDI